MQRRSERAVGWARSHRVAAAAAAGRQPFEWLITHVRVVNVCTGEVLPGHIGMAAGLFSGRRTGD